MAIWFATLASDKVAVRKGLRVYASAMPGWLGRGISAAAADRFHPTVRP